MQLFRSTDQFTLWFILKERPVLRSVTIVRKHVFGGWKRNNVIFVLIGLSLSAYFLVSISILPSWYVKLPKLRPVPLISNTTTISLPQIHLGQTFYLKVTAENVGDNADIQIISVGFPNLTSIDRYIHIRESDFSQKPVFVKIGEKVGSDYTGLEDIVYARYPSIEAFSRPWHSKDVHHIEFEVRPYSVGKFVIYLKAIALPHGNDFAHYPRNGIKDYQNEFVKLYSIKVMKN